MKNLKTNAAANRVTYLRVYYGEESEKPRSPTPLAMDPPPHNVNEEVEAIWAGRTPAARFSARIAA